MGLDIDKIEIKGPRHDRCLDQRTSQKVQHQEVLGEGKEIQGNQMICKHLINHCSGQPLRDVDGRSCHCECDTDAPLGTKHLEGETIQWGYTANSSMSSKTSYLQGTKVTTSSSRRAHFWIEPTVRENFRFNDFIRFDTRIIVFWCVVTQFQSLENRRPKAE